jgi:peptide/nickel transport system permease protein
MTRYLARRLLLGCFVVVGVVFLTFVIARVVPGDPALAWAGPHASPRQLAEARVELGLDDPFWTQIGNYVSGVFSGDWGVSLRTHQPVLSDIGHALPQSLELLGAAMLIAIVLGIPLGIAAARSRENRATGAGGGHGVIDMVVRVISVAGVSMPVFWVGMLGQLIFFKALGLLPVAGPYDPSVVYAHPLTSYVNMPVIDSLVTGNWVVFGNTLEHLVLPAFCVALYPLGVIARMLRASEIETLGDTHVRLARALGFKERTIYWRFALKPSLNPVLSVIALVASYSLVNAFLVETVFDWPGIGSYAALSIQAIDTPAIIGVTLVVAIVYVVANLLVDLAQAAIDPRIRLHD